MDHPEFLTTISLEERQLFAFAKWQGEGLKALVAFRYYLLLSPSSTHVVIGLRRVM